MYEINMQFIKIFILSLSLNNYCHQILQNEREQIKSFKITISYFNFKSLL